MDFEFADFLFILIVFMRDQRYDQGLILSLLFNIVLSRLRIYRDIVSPAQVSKYLYADFIVLK